MYFFYYIMYTFHVAGIATFFSIIKIIKVLYEADRVVLCLTKEEVNVKTNEWVLAACVIYKNLSFRILYLNFYFRVLDSPKRSDEHPQQPLAVSLKFAHAHLWYKLRTMKNNRLMETMNKV